MNKCFIIKVFIIKNKKVFLVKKVPDGLNTTNLLLDLNKIWLEYIASML